MRQVCKTATDQRKVYMKVKKEFRIIAFVPADQKVV